MAQNSSDQTKASDVMKPLKSINVSGKYSQEVTDEMHELGRQATIAEEKEDLLESAKCMKDLGENYLAIAQETHAGDHFDKACALLNAALIRVNKHQTQGTNNGLHELIHEIERLLQMVLQKFLESICIEEKDSESKTPKYKQLLSKIRTFSSDKVNGLMSHMKVDINTEMSKEDTEATLAKCPEFFDGLTDEMIQFYRTIFHDCYKVLGFPPCPYAILGLGSLARREATAYSDIESAVLYDDITKSQQENEGVKQYFRNLSHYFNISLINLGETLLPSMSIPVLNDFNNELQDHQCDNKFYDRITPSGVSSDGAMPWASKTPLGRKKTEEKDPLELIMTIDEMAEYQEEDIVLKQGYHLSDVLMTVILIDGEEDLVQKYREKIVNIQRSSSKEFPHKTVGEIRGLTTLKEDSEKYQEKPLNPESFKTPLDAKKDVYRYTTMSVNSCKIVFNCTDDSPIQVLKELEQRGILTSSACTDLQMMTCTPILLRHYIYGKYNRQKNDLSFIMPEDSDTKHLVSARVFMGIYRFYFTFKPWSEHLLSLFTKKSLSEISSSDITFRMTYFDNSNTIKGDLHMSMDFPKHALRAFIEEEKQLRSSGQDKSSEMLSILNLIGFNYHKLDDYKNAFQYYKCCLETCQFIYGGKPDQAVAISHYNMAILQKVKGHHAEAEENYSKALVMYRQVHGDVPHSDIANTLLNMANLQDDKGDHAEAEENFSKALVMYRQVHGDVPHSDIAGTLLNMANLQKDKGDHAEAEENYNKALAMYRQVHGDVPHIVIVRTFYNMAVLQQSKGDYVKAEENYNKTLVMYRQVHGEVPHYYIAHTLLGIATLQKVKGDHAEAEENYNKALVMYRQVHGDVPHSDIANTLLNMANLQEDKGDHAEAEENYSKALIMYSQLHPDDHPSVKKALENITAFRERTS